ncbi:hypothetical protein ABKA04_005105 [Annulohypoxylon sp. FPYF3050]
MDRAVPITHQPSATPQNEAKFHLFNLLPPELRREIYILATPPRVVNVQEVGACSEAWYERLEKFAETCRTTLIQFRLHPDLAYFAHNWRPSIASKLRSHNQLPLEAYGFTSTKGRYQPWIPTDDTPEIPSTWLASHPDTAWAMTRDASLYSPAPIPPFLHVCSESREMLKKYGYQLAFGTRTDEPHTWFHFERDILSIRFVSSELPNVLVNEGWDIGLFRPKLMSDNGNGPTHQWNVPRVRLVHTCTLEKADYIFSERRKLWKQFNATKTRLARGRISKLRAKNEQSKKIPEYMDVGEAFLRANGPDHDEERQFFLANDMSSPWPRLHGDYYNRGNFTLPVCEEELWWLNSAVLFPPRIKK